jgi:Transglutaminase elicitor
VKNLLFLLLSFSTFASVNLDDKRAWDSISDPDRMLDTFEREFSALPLTGKIQDPNRLWSSDYWARRKGGINYRWNSSSPSGFNLVSPTKLQASQMSISQLRALAATEKWDLLNGRYDYPAKREVAAYADPRAALWSGICHGWAPASLNHDEPDPVTLRNPDGIFIPFGTSDIKALLSWYYADKFDAPTTHQMGRRCYGRYPPDNSDRCRQDMNAGAFHLVLTNRLGISGVSFVADVDISEEVWNHAIWSYKTSITNRNVRPLSSSAAGTVKMVRVKTVIEYVATTKNHWNPVLGTSNQKTKLKTFDYYLDIDARGRIIGGEWPSYQRPDFLWLVYRPPSFEGYYKRLPELLSGE